MNCIFNDGYKLDVNDRIYRLKIANIILQRGLDVILSFIDPKYQSFVRDDFKKIKDLSAVLAATYPN